jgi:hypothetical protein
MNATEKMGSIGHPVSKIWPKLWANIGLKTLAGQCPVRPTGGLWKLKWQAEQCSGQVGQCPVGPDKVRLGVSENTNFGQNPPISSQTWFLSYRPRNRMKLGQNGHLNIMNKFPKEVFPKFKDFNFDFEWTQRIRFWENWVKSVKSNGLEPWIHSKVGGRWRGSS